MAQRIASLESPLPTGVAQSLGKLLPEGMRAPNLFTAVARNESLFSYLVESGLIGPTGLFDRRLLPRALRECIILRTCVACGNDYEFNLHVQTISTRMGLSVAQINDVRSEIPDSRYWDGAELAAMRLVDGLVKTLKVEPEVFAQCREHFTEPVLIEITQLVGFYVGVAMQVALIAPEFDRYTSAEPHLARAGSSGAGMQD